VNRLGKGKTEDHFLEKGPIRFGPGIVGALKQTYDGILPSGGLECGLNHEGYLRSKTQEMIISLLMWRFCRICGSWAALIQVDSRTARTNAKPCSLIAEALQQALTNPHGDVT
jgi:hypothetical protein